MVRVRGVRRGPAGLRPGGAPGSPALSPPPRLARVWAPDLDDALPGGLVGLQASRGRPPARPVPLVLRRDPLRALPPERPQLQLERIQHRRGPASRRRAVLPLDSAPGGPPPTPRRGRLRRGARRPLRPRLVVRAHRLLPPLRLPLVRFRRATPPPEPPASADGVLARLDRRCLPLPLGRTTQRPPVPPGGVARLPAAPRRRPDPSGVRVRAAPGQRRPARRRGDRRRPRAGQAAHGPRRVRSRGAPARPRLPCSPTSPSSPVSSSTASTC